MADRYELAGLRGIEMPDVGEPIDLIQDLLIREQDLNEAYMRYPATVAFWTAVSEKADFMIEEQKEMVRTAERNLNDLVYPSLDREIRNEYAGEKLTESRIANLIKSHERYRQETRILDRQRGELLRLKRMAVPIHAALAGVKAMGDSLVGLGANFRAERNAENTRINKS